jgi:hypothetical protein
MASGYEAAQVASEVQADRRREAYEYEATGGYQEDSGGQAAAGALTTLAAVLMLLAGVWSFFTGLAAVMKGSFFVATPNYLYDIDIHSWGWIHIGLGALVFVIGCCLFTRQTWARVAGLVVVIGSAFMNFLFIPRYPVWAFLMIALDIAIIWALATVHRETY